MKAIVGFILVFMLGQVQAQLIFRDNFGPLDILPLFPESDGVFTLPDEPAPNRILWLIEQLNTDTTSLAEINANFSANWISQISAVDTQNFIQSVRVSYPNAKITDLQTLSPMEAVVFIEGSNGQTGFIRMQAIYTLNQGINFLQVQARDNVVQFPEDNNLTLGEAITKFTTFASDTGVLVAYINDDDECQMIDAHNPDQLLATGSLFKPWILGGLAEAVDQGSLLPDQDVEFVASERVFNNTLVNFEPFGTQFKLADLAALMIGNSDNTATDLVHETVGRSVIDDYIDVSGVGDADVLKPLLSVNEQFHLFFSFDLPTATGFVNDTEANQLTFINNQIVPLGPVANFPFSNDSLLTAGSWRASPMDICNNMAALRLYEKGTAARAVVDRAYGAQVAQFRIRPNWDRAWYKGGSLVSGVTGFHVLTHAWMLENNGRWPIVVVGMTNDSAGGITDNGGGSKIRSVLARIIELAGQGL